MTDCLTDKSSRVIIMLREKKAKLCNRRHATAVIQHCSMILVKLRNVSANIVQQPTELWGSLSMHLELRSTCTSFRTLYVHVGFFAVCKIK